MATIIIPAVLRKLTQQQPKVIIEGDTIQEVFNNLIQQYPAFKIYLCDKNNELPSFVSIYLNDKNIKHYSQETISITDHDIVTIIPAIAGG